MNEHSADLARFLAGEANLGEFSHQEHVRMAFETLRRYEFPESVLLFSSALKTMAARAGKVRAFHQTVTIAFLSLIAERIESGCDTDFDRFARANADVLDKSALARWYSPDRLAVDAARRTFILPDPAIRPPFGGYHGQ